MTVTHIKLIKEDNSTDNLTSTTPTTTTLCHDHTIDHFNDELLQTTFKWMFWSPHHLVKDDVFFAPPSITSTVVNQNWVPTPCLSPVTSPSDFLCDREPLFDGIDGGEDIYNEQQEVITDTHHLDSNNSIIMNNDDDWSTLFSSDEYDFLPLTPSSTTPGNGNTSSTGSSSSTVVSDEESGDEFNFDHNKQQWVMNQTKPCAITTLPTITTTTTTTKHSLKRRITDDEEPTYKRSKSQLTLFQNLTKMGIDWCRYCGTTEGVNWRPGPWGKRTLCNKHGCDYKGYGLASRMPRLDLSAFTKEKLEERKRPIVQQFCVVCQSPEKSSKNKLIPCEGGCSRAYHQDCHTIKDTYCTSLCHENKQKNKVVVDLPRKYLPLMRSQQPKKSFLL